MSNSTWVRWSGAAAIVFGVLVFVSGALRIVGGFAVTAAALSFAAMFVGALALIGMFARQNARAGVFGVIGFVVALIGVMLSAAQMYALTFITPTLAEKFPDALVQVNSGPLGFLFPLGYGSFLFGFILFSLAVIRAKVLPRWAAVALIVGAVLNVAGIGAVIVRLAGILIFGAGAVWIGVALWKKPSE
ncbi:MAG: hypothetical protein HY327_09785 [Chloroflexi bacterium]|nr:hypothetical protein [Chloroflexota bacterium]